MEQVIIALVSEQRMQNIIPCLQRGQAFSHVWLVRSTDADIPNSRFALAMENTREALSNLNVPVNLPKSPVGAYGVVETQKMVSEIIQQETGARVVVNFTGGTKCMSIGAYLAAQDTRTTALYVDTANEKLVWFHPEGRTEEQEFDLAGRLTADVYLRAYGKLIDAERTRQHALPESAHAAAKELVSLWPDCVATLESFGNAISQKQSSVGPDMVAGEALPLCQHE
jgi:hypothetical protein